MRRCLVTIFLRFPFTFTEGVHYILHTVQLYHHITSYLFFRIWKRVPTEAKKFSFCLSLPVLLAASSYQKGQFMAEPITDGAEIYAEEDMKARMELLILRIQVS